MSASAVRESKSQSTWTVLMDWSKSGVAHVRNGREIEGRRSETMYSTLETVNFTS